MLILQLFNSKHVFHSQDGCYAATEVAVELVSLGDTIALRAITGVNLQDTRAQPIVPVGTEGQVFG